MDKKRCFFYTTLLLCVWGVKVFASEESLYPVSKLILVYDTHHLTDIPIKTLEEIPVSFLEKGHALYGLQEKGEELRDAEVHTLSIDEINHREVTYFSKQALQEVMQALLAYFNQNNIHWTHLHLPQDEIGPDGFDLRNPIDATLTIMISVPMVNGSKIVFLDPDRPSREISYPKQAKRVYDNLPVSLADPSTGYPGGFINSNLLNNYLHSLNRHPGRRVDLEIDSAVPGGVDLNFVITEDKPYHFYFNANNNVPRVLHRWQESLGFIHTQLTGNDDILSLDANTDSFDQLYSFNASYGAPLGRSIGNRWQLSGSYSRFVSAEFALPQNLFVGTQAVFTGEILSNLAQWDRLFLDLVADLQYRHIHNRGHFLFSSATKNFLLPSLGLKLTQLKRESKLVASLSVQSTMSSLFWNVRKNLDDLGRRDISPNWAIVQGGLYAAFYLEPFLHRPENVKRLANEIVLVGQFQNACNQRLIPELEGILGGLYTIRGYPQSTIAGDNLYMGSFEYRLHLPQTLRPRPHASKKIFGKCLRWAPEVPKGDIDWDFMLRAFYDIGQTTVNQRKHFEKNYLISGAGMGAELVLWHNIFIRADFGAALRKANGVSRGNHQFYFSSTVVY